MNVTCFAVPTVLRLPLLFLLFLPVAASAEQAASASPGVSTGTYVQAMLALAFIVALLAATAWFARRVSGGKGFGGGGMKVVGGVALGPKERIILLEVGEECLVVGIVPGQIRTLHRLPKGSVLPASAETPEDKPFAQWLKQITERRGHGDA